MAWKIDSHKARDHKIDVIVPYEPGNIGKAYNQAMAKVDDWVLFLDSDILLLRPQWYEMCLDAIEQVGHKAGWISGVTNRTWCDDQKFTPQSAHDDIRGHIKYSNELYRQYGSQLIKPQSDKPMSGFFILTHKEAWEKVNGFTENVFMGVDNDYHKRLVSAGYELYIMPGLYMYHLHQIKDLFDKEAKLVKKSNHKGVKISFMMIVRNEAKNLPRCLQSIVPLADELVVLDTGSTDNSMEICRNFGARVYQPDNLKEYFVETEFGPQINFSKARNKCMEYCTGNWLFQIDADEELVLDGAAPNEIRKFLKETTANGICPALRDYQGGKMMATLTPTRLFRKGCVHYINIVHNKAIVEGERRHLVELVLNHYGYDVSPEERKKKFKRSVGLLNKRLEDNPNDYEAMFYLSQYHGWLNDEDKCLEYAEIYAKHRDIIPENEFQRSVYYTLIKRYMKVNKLDKAREWLDRGSVLEPTSLDLMYAAFDLGRSTKDHTLAVEGASKFVQRYTEMAQKKEGYGYFTFNFRPEFMCECAYYLAMTQLEKGVIALTGLQQALQQCADKQFAQNLAANVFQNMSRLGLQPTRPVVASQSS